MRYYTHSSIVAPLRRFTCAAHVSPEQVDCLKFLLSLPDTDTEIQNIQGRRAGEGMQELMRDDSNDEETVRLLTESRVRQGITRL